MSSPPRFSAGDIQNRLAGTDVADAASFAGPLAAFLSLLARWNRVYNLTGFREPQQLLERVLLECLWLRRWLAGNAIADIGSGAGLPGMPLAITEPQRRFTLIEPRAKRVHFLQHVVGELGLGNVTIAQSRAEDLPPGDGFATVLGRAVAAPPDFMTIARHLTRPGSRIVLLTSPDKGAAYRDTPEDFTLREIVPAGAGGQFGVVVHLERVS